MAHHRRERSERITGWQATTIVAPSNRHTTSPARMIRFCVSAAQDADAAGRADDADGLRSECRLWIAVQKAIALDRPREVQQNLALTACSASSPALPVGDADGAADVVVAWVEEHDHDPPGDLDPRALARLNLANLAPPAPVVLIGPTG